MPRQRADRGRASSKGLDGQKANASNSPADSDPKMSIRPPSNSVADFEAVAQLIVSNSPEWLAEELMRWAPTIFLSYAVEKRQPKRAQMKKILTAVSDAAALLIRALREAPVCEFLNAGGDGPMDKPSNFQWILREIQSRAERAGKLPNLVGSDGQLKAGRGRAMPDGATSAQTFCALYIAEVWKWFHGEYPPSDNKRAGEAIDRYWAASGGEKQSWGNKSINSWRHHLKKSRKAQDQGMRAEICRHLDAAKLWAEYSKSGT